MQKRSSFPASLWVAAIAVVVVLLLLQVGGQAGTGALVLSSGELPTTEPGLPAAEVETTVTEQPAVTDPPTTLAPPVTDPPTTAAALPVVTDPPVTIPVVATDPPTTVVVATDPPTTAPPPTDPPTTAPPATNPPTTAPPATNPPTTAPPATNPPTTAPPATHPPTTAPAVIGPNAQPPATSPPPGAGAAAAGPGSTSSGSGGSGPAGAFKSAVHAVGSTAASAAERVVMPAVRKLVRMPAARRLAESQPVAATRQAVAMAAEELRDLKPATIVPYLWLALLALLVTTGAFLRLWWAPPDWPSLRSLAVGVHRRAGQQPRGWQVGWPATPRPAAPRRNGGWRPPLPAATVLATRRLPHRVGIDVGRLRSVPPPGKPVFTGRDDPDLPG